MVQTIKTLNGERLYNDYFNNLNYLSTNGWVSGCEVTESTVPAMSVDVASGSVLVNSVPVVVGAQTVVISAADPSNPRFDIIVADGAGTPSVITGTPAADPKPDDSYDPTLYAILARVFVDDNVTQIFDADIKDLRAPAGGSGGGASSKLFSVPQSGCTNGDAVRFDGANFVPAQANSIVNSRVVGIIDNISGGSGDVYLFGEIDFLSGLTAGSIYYLSETVAGALTTTRPAISVKMGVATDSTTLILDIDRTVGGAGNRYVQAFSGTSVTVTHNLNDTLPVVQVYDSSNEWITPDTLTITDANTVTLTFSVSTAGNVVVQSLTSFTTDTGTTAYYSQTFTTTTSVVVAHNLNQQYVAVQVYDGSNVLIEPLSVTLDNANQCTVTFGANQSGRVVVVGGATFGSAVGTGDLLPNADNAYDIGSGGARWANFYLGGDANIDGDINAAADINTASGLDSIKGGQFKLDIQSMAGDLTNPPDSGIVGVAPTLDFDASTAQYAYFQFRTPTDIDDTQDVTVEMVFCMQSANVGASVVITLDANAIADTEDGTPSIESSTTDTISVPNALDEYKFYATSTLKIPASIISGDQVISCKLGRDATSGSDTATGDWRLVSFRLVYQRL